MPLQIQCSKNYFNYGDDCLNGTVYKQVELEISGPGGCCAACQHDGFDKCQGWSMPDRNGAV